MATRRRRTTTRRRRTTTGRRKTATRRRRTTRKKKPQFKLSQSVSREISALFFLGFAILSFLAIQGNAGSFGLMWNERVLTPLFGIGAFIVPAFALVLGSALLLARQVSFAFGRSFGVAMLTVSALGLIQLSAPIGSLFESASQYGGYIGFTINFILYMLFGQTGATVVLCVAALVSLLLIFNISFSELFGFIGESMQPEPLTAAEKKKLEKEAKKKEKEAKKKEKEEEAFALNIVRGADKKNEETLVGRVIKPKKITPAKKEVVPITTQKAPEVETIPEEQPKIDYTNYELPKLEFLGIDPKTSDGGDDQLVQNAEIIRRKLEQFNIKVTMKDAHVGPTVTQFTLKPAEDVKLSKITSLKNDLALALSANAIRIEAPIPGKGLVGIEVPAHERATVNLGSIIRSQLFQKEKGDLKLVLGRDVSGHPIVADLVKMPHLLVAGQTGSGKSIGINSFLVSLLYQHSPESLRIILIDPKRVELTNYNNIPHLLTPVITEPDKALQSLKWAVSEMNRRYKELAKHGTRNIDEYNEKFPENRMPYLVIVIDELADLMMAASKEIEATICRLAQMARATGIHLIIATQRPSVDVITGLIKANVPTRISYTVATGTDSRTVIDSVGAEDLLGQGDLLYLASNMAKPLRVQGAFVSTKEIEKVIHFIKLNSPGGVQYNDNVIAPKDDTPIAGLPPKVGGKTISGDGNSDIERAIQAIREGKKASASYLQRRCSIGYAKAARLLDELEEMGLVGPSNGAKPRQIFITEEEEEPQAENAELAEEPTAA